MKPRRLDTAISFALSTRERMVIEQLAETKEMSLGEAARELLNAGITARGIEC